MSAMHNAVHSIEEQAANWIVLLTADDPSERNSAAQDYAAWKALDQRHHAAADQIERFLDRTSILQGSNAQAQAGKQALRQVLAGQRHRSRRLDTATGIVAVLFLLISSLLVLQQLHILPFGADITSPKAQMITKTLQDGSKLILGSNSAVKLHFTGTERRIELLHGQLHLTVAKDPTRPLVVETAQGEIRALGTRFMVREQPETTVLEMLESKVAVRLRQTPQTETVINASERLIFSKNRIITREPLDSRGNEAAFMSQRMILDNEPLGNVLVELGRHTSGLLHVNQQAVAELRISGVLPLNDGQSALDMIKATFPQLAVTRHAGGYLTLVQ